MVDMTPEQVVDWFTQDRKLSVLFKEWAEIEKESREKACDAAHQDGIKIGLSYNEISGAWHTLRGYVIGVVMGVLAG